MVLASHTAPSSFVLALVIGLSGCGTASEELGARQESMIGGDPSPAGGEDDSVLLLRATTEGDVICTATLVAPNLALSARHCVAFNGPPPFKCTKTGELVPNATGGGTLGADYAPGTVELYTVDNRTEPVALVSQVFSTLTDTICRNDIAYLLLDRDVNLPSRGIRLDKVTAKSELLTLVGYGATTTGEPLDYQALVRKRVSHWPIEDVGPDTPDGVIFRAPPRTFVLEGPASCSGDSGGPAFSEETGAVVGVFSILGDANCSAENIELFYTQTGPFAQLAAAAFEAAGAEPLTEPEPPVGSEPQPTDDAGAQPTPASPEPESSGCRLGARKTGGGSWLLAFAFAALARRRERKGIK